MKLAIALATISWLGCGVDTGVPRPPGGGDDTAEPTSDPSDPPIDPNDPGTGAGTVTEVTGHITASTTWSQAIHVTGSIIIDPGVTVTVLPGTTVDIPTSTSITVSGVLDLQGTKEQRVTLRGATGNFWSDVVVPHGGVLTAHYLVQTGGGLDISADGKATVVDSHFSHVGGDLLIMSNGTLDMSYSAIGLDAGRDVMHCDLHVGGTAPHIKLTHSNISASSFGIMFYGGTNADFTYNNWFGNANDIITEPGPPVTGDFSYSYFAKGTPTNPGVTATHMATAMLTDAGPR